MDKKTIISLLATSVLVLIVLSGHTKIEIRKPFSEAAVGQKIVNVAEVSYFPARTTTARSSEFLVLPSLPAPEPNDLVALRSKRLKDVIRNTQALSRDYQNSMEEATRYHGYKDPRAVGIRFRLVRSKNILNPLPLITLTEQASSTESFSHAGYFQKGSPIIDYPKILQEMNVCDLVDNKNVSQIWIWGYPGVQGLEWAIVNKSSDVVPSTHLFINFPRCQKTYFVLSFNYGRDVALALHSTGHMLEHIFYTRDSELFDLWIGDKRSPRGCGNVHYPYNTRQDYGYVDEALGSSDCEDWRPDGGGAVQQFSCLRWNQLRNPQTSRCSDDTLSQKNYLIYWMQNIPGAGNMLSYKGDALRNWWDFYTDYDAQYGVRFLTNSDDESPEILSTRYFINDVENATEARQNDVLKIQATIRGASSLQIRFTSKGHWSIEDDFAASFPLLKKYTSGQCSLVGECSFLIPLVKDIFNYSPLELDPTVVYFVNALSSANRASPLNTEAHKYIAAIKKLPPLPACSNDKDDDGDGKIDLADIGCASSEDDSEVDVQSVDMSVEGFNFGTSVATPQPIFENTNVTPQLLLRANPPLPGSVSFENLRGVCFGYAKDGPAFCSTTSKVTIEKNTEKTAVLMKSIVLPQGLFLTKWCYPFSFNAVVDGNTLNDCHAMQINVLPLPASMLSSADLAIEWINTKPVNASIDTPFSLDASVINIGKATSGQYFGRYTVEKVRNWISGDPLTNITDHNNLQVVHESFIQGSYLVSLARARFLQKDIWTPAEAGNYLVRLCISGIDTNISNNCAWRTVYVGE